MPGKHLGSNIPVPVTCQSFQEPAVLPFLDQEKVESLTPKACPGIVARFILRFACHRDGDKPEGLHILQHDVSVYRFASALQRHRWVGHVCPGGTQVRPRKGAGPPSLGRRGRCPAVLGNARSMEVSMSSCIRPCALSSAGSAFLGSSSLPLRMSRRTRADFE